MKSIKKYLFLTMVAGISMVSCKNESSTVKEEARESLATTENNVANPAAKTDGPVINVPTGPTTTIDFMGKEVYDFGTIMEGEVVEHVFKFKNTGDNELIIQNAKGSCGCTVPDWPRNPILPGEESQIVVKFDSKGKGQVGGKLDSKKVTITANTEPANTYLTIKGTINREDTTES